MVTCLYHCEVTGCRLLQFDDVISPDPDRKVSFRTTLVVPGVLSVCVPCYFHNSVLNELTLAILSASTEILLVEYWLPFSVRNQTVQWQLWS